MEVFRLRESYYDQHVVPFCTHCGVETERTARVCPQCGTLQAATQRSSLSKGSTIDRGYGRFVIDRRVGEGGMGVVYRAWLFRAPGFEAEGPGGPELTALKVLRPELNEHPELLTLFENEAQALRILRHPNVVRFIDQFDHEGLRVLAMEYVDGDTLDDVIQRNVARARLTGARVPALPFRRAWAYFEQLLGTLASLHALGIVHRDIKPSNLLIRRDGVAKLTDFGIARLAPTGHTGALAPGTGAYMAPEQVLGAPLDGRSDLYSAGIVLYEALVGFTPFLPGAQSEFEVRRRQVEAAPPLIRTYLPTAPPVLDALFLRALCKDPAGRFLSAREMGEAFRGALGIAATETWAALLGLADALAEARSSGASHTFPMAAASAARASRVATMRDRILTRYATAEMASDVLGDPRRPDD
jgi:serine/threonine-protein kinase